MVAVVTCQNSLQKLFEKTTPTFEYIALPTVVSNVKVIRILWPYRLVIVDRAVLCHLRVNTRRCGGGGWGSRPYQPPSRHFVVSIASFLVTDPAPYLS